MKRLKGFAFGGVLIFNTLASIASVVLVPTMIGYTKKANFSRTMSDAKSCMQAINSALVECDIKGEDVSENITITYTDREGFFIEGVSDTVIEEIEKTLDNYAVLDYDFIAACENGTCIAVACLDDSGIIATYPSVTTIDNCKNYASGLEGALADAMIM